jgi:hypothetical protein
VFYFDKTRPLAVRAFRWSSDIPKDDAIEYEIFSKMRDPHPLVAPEEHGLTPISDECFTMENVGLSDERKEQVKDIIHMNCSPMAKEWWEETFL